MDDTPGTAPGEESTRILNEESAESTRVTPTAAGSGAPPAPPMQPTIVMSRPARKGPGNMLWLVLLLLLVIAAAAAAIWFYWLRGEQEATTVPSPTPAPIAWAGAWARTDGTGGGLVVEGDATTYRVTAYNGALQPSDTVDAVESADGRELLFALPSHFTFDGPAGPSEAALTIGSDPGTATFRVVGADQTTVSLPVQRVATLTPTAPSADPTATEPAPDPGPTSAEQALRQQTIDAITSIQAGIAAWAAANGSVYPMPADARESGTVAQYVDPWPVNPYAPGQPMEPGTDPGDYTYERLDGGRSFRLAGYLDNGAFIVP